MISKNKARFIISLREKKTREEERLYVVEGDKIVREFLAAGIPLKMLVAKPEFIRSVPPDQLPATCETEEVSFEELRHISTMKTPHNALAVVHIPEQQLNVNEVLNELCIALEFVQDPGNMGTIIRAAGWFGIQNIVCSEDCVDVYNPRVIQASMGAMLHVKVYSYPLEKFLGEAVAKNVPVFGTLLEGQSIYDHKLDNKGVILLGNESKGISEQLQSYISEKIMIPRFSPAKPGIDSLNVGMAASVVFSEFRRRGQKTQN
jgi:TrmH family RNA methyltransferase